MRRVPRDAAAAFAGRGEDDAHARTRSAGRRTAAPRTARIRAREPPTVDRKSVEPYTFLDSPFTNAFALYDAKNRDSIIATTTGDGSFDFGGVLRTKDRQSPSGAEMIPIHK
jgi:hypothetical protein